MRSVNWVKKWFVGKTRTIRNNKPVAKKHSRLASFLLEMLEARIVPTWYTWTGGGGDSNWSTPGNWTSVLGPGVPGADDTAEFADASSNCVIDTATTVGSVQVDPSYTGTITVSNDLTLDGGESAFYGSTTGSMFEIPSGAALSFAGGIGGVFAAGSVTGVPGSGVGAIVVADGSEVIFQQYFQTLAVPLDVDGNVIFDANFNPTSVAVQANITVGGDSILTLYGGDSTASATLAGATDGTTGAALQYIDNFGTVYIDTTDTSSPVLSNLPILNEAGGTLDVASGSLTVTGGCSATDGNSVYQPAGSAGASIDLGSLGYRSPGLLYVGSGLDAEAGSINSMFSSDGQTIAATGGGTADITIACPVNFENDCVVGVSTFATLYLQASQVDVSGATFNMNIEGDTGGTSPGPSSTDWSDVVEFGAGTSVITESDSSSWALNVTAFGTIGEARKWDLFSLDSGASFASPVANLDPGSPFTFFFDASDNGAGAILTQSPTSVTVSSWEDPSVYGEPVTFTATMTADQWGASPTGTLTFYDGTTELGSPVSVDSYYPTATFTTSCLPVGSDAITAVYSGDLFYITSTGGLDQEVDKADTTTTLSASPDFSITGESVTLTATVAAESPGSGTPTGTVTFYADDVSLGTITLVDGVASLTTTALPDGYDLVTAVYSGDAHFNSSYDEQDHPVVDLAPLTFYTVEGQTYAGTAATIELPWEVDPSTLSATIQWESDATATSGSVVDATVRGSYEYDEEGTYSVLVTLTDATGGSVSVTSTAVVADAPLTFTAPDGDWGYYSSGDSGAPTGVGTELTSMQGEPTGGVDLATFDLAYAASDYSAVIDWGDGSSIQSGTVESDGSVYSSIGHTYANPGVYVTHVRLVGPSLDGDAYGTVTVGSAAPAGNLTATGYQPPWTWDSTWQPTFLTAGVATSSVTLATFTDVDEALGPNAFAAQVDWGDGTAQQLADVVIGEDGLSVLGSHAYAAAGDYPVEVVITSPNGSATTWTTAVVSSGLSVEGTTFATPTSSTLPAGEGEPDALLASFTDPTHATTASDYTATIDWGDGTTATGEVTGGQGQFWVYGAPILDQPGDYTATIVIVEQQAGSNPINNTTVVATTEITAIDAMVGQPLSSRPIALVQDADADDPDAPGCMTTSVDWGGALPGPTTFDTVYYGGGAYEVYSSAPGEEGVTYAAPGTYTVQTTMVDDGGSETSGNLPLLISGAPLVDLTGELAPLAPTAGLLSAPTVAEFHDENPYNGAGDYSATIYWGDGTTSSATDIEAADGSQNYDVVGPDHTYTQGGTYQISVLISDADWTMVATMTVVTAGSTPAVWSASAVERKDDSVTGTWLPFGEALVSPNTGALRLSQPLDFDLQGVASQTQTTLTYNSATVAQPIIEVTLPTEGDVTSIEATLTWAGVDQGPVTFSATGPEGSTYVMDLPVGTPVTASGVYFWQVDLTATLADGAQAVATTTGESEEVVNASSPFGAGWDLSGVSRLVVTPQGVLRTDGLGGEHFFALNSDYTFATPPGDFGVLEAIPWTLGGGYTYTDKDQTVYTYDGSGDLLSVVDRDGVERDYAYENGLLTQVTAADGSVTTLDYDPDSGLLDEINEPGGRVLTFSEDDNGDLTDLVDADGAERNFTYAGGHLLSNDSWDPYDTSFVYTSGRLTEVELGSVQSEAIAPAAIVALNAPILLSAQGVGTVTDGDGNEIAYTLEAAHGWMLQEVQPGDLVQTWVFDTDGDATTMTDADGNTTTSTYSDGDLMSVTNPDSSTESYEYDATFHQMTQETDGDGDVTVWEIDATNGDVLSMTTAYDTSAAATTSYTWSQGLLTSETDADGNVTTYSYNDLRQLIQQVTGDVDDEEFTYDDAGNPETSTVGADGSAPETTYTVYSGANLLLSTTDADGDETSYTYAAAGLVTSTTDGRGFETLYVLNVAGLVVEEDDDDNTGAPESTDDVFDGAGNQTRTTDPDGNYTVDAYDDDNCIVQTTSYDAGDNILSQTSWTYDANGNPLTQTDELGNKTVWTYDPMGRVHTQKSYDAGDNLVSSLTYTYDADGNVLTTTDGDGTETTDEYNPAGDVVSEVVSAGGGVLSSQSFTYDGIDNVLTSTDALENTTSDTWDDWELTEEKVVDSGGGTISDVRNDYDLDGNVTLSTDGDGTETSTTFDDDNNELSEIVTGLSGTVTGSGSFTYDGDGDVVTSADGAGNVTSYVYNDDDQPVTQTVLDDGGGPVSWQKFSYDLAGYETLAIDGDSVTTSDSYDGGNLTKEVVTDGDGNTLSSSGFTYDEAGEETKETDANLLTTSAGFDGGEMTLQEVTGSDGKTVSLESYSYDEAGNVTLTTDADGTTTSDSYDGYDLTKEVVTDGSSHTLSWQSFTYDEDGDETKENDGGKLTTSASYDAGLVMFQVVTGTGGTVSWQSFSYDEDGNPTLTTDGTGATTSDSYDGGNLTQEVVTDGHGNTLSSTDFTYDGDGEETSETDGGLLTTANSYDGGNLTLQVVTGPAGEVSRQSFSYDDANSLTLSVDGDGNQTLDSYDGGNLTLEVIKDSEGATVSWQRFTYDQIGDQTSENDANKLTTAATYDGGLVTYQVVKDAAGNTVNWQSFSYDDMGNPTLTVDGGGITTSDSYDGGQMTLEVVTDGSGHTQSWQSFGYDAADNQTLSIQDDVTTSTSFDGDLPTLQVAKDSSGNILSSTGFTYDDGGDETGENDGGLLATASSYDAGQVTFQAVLDATSHTVNWQSFSYDELGNATLTIDGGSVTTSSSYDGYNLVQELTTDRAGNTIDQQSFGYDEDDTQTLAVDGAGTTTSDGYDGDNLTLETVTGASGQTLSRESFTYDDAGEETSETDGAGQLTTASSYDGGLVTLQVVKDSASHTLTWQSFSYDAVEDATLTIDGGSVTTSDGYDGENLTKEVVTDGSSHTLSWMSYSYDDANNATLTVDGASNTTAASYDGDNVTKEVVTDAASHTVSWQSFTYDPLGEQTNENDGGVLTTAASYDGGQMALEVVTGSSHTVSWQSFSYDEYGNPTLTTSGDGTTTSDSYDGFDLTQEVVTDGHGNTLSSTDFSYDGDGEETSENDANELTTASSYDGGQVTLAVVTDSSGATVNWQSFGYDALGNQTLSIQDDVTTSSTYDGDLPKVVVVTGASGATLSWQSFTYDEDENLTLTTDGDGNKTLDSYEGDLLTLQVVKDASNNTVSWQSFTYDDAGEQTSENDGGQMTTAVSYDGGQVAFQAVKDSSGNTVSWQSFSYDDNGDPTLTIDGGSLTTSDGYDGDNLTKEVVTDSTTHTLSWQSYSYDDANNPTLTIDGGSVTTSDSYDGENVTKEVVTDSAGTTLSSTSFTYDEVGDETSENDGGVLTTASSYDGGQVTYQAVIGASGTVSWQSFSYDDAGDPTLTIDGDGVTTSDGYDGGSLTQEVVTGSTAAVSSMSYSYDDVGSLTLSVDGDGVTTSDSYDGDNLAKEVVNDSLGNILSSTSFSYDAAGDETSENDGGLLTTASSYDGGQVTLEVVTDSTTHTLSWQSFSYDELGDATQTIDGGSVTTSDNYDGDNLTLEVMTDSSSHTLSWQSFTYDDLDRATLTLDEGLATSDTYDGNNLAKEVVLGVDGALSSVSYSYDEAGNATLTVDGGITTSDTYDGGNLALEVVKDSLGNILSSTSFTYDAGGEETSENDGGLLTTASSYDGGQMTFQAVIGSSGTVSWQSFSYDDAGNPTLTIDGGDVTTSDSYDGGYLTLQVVTGAGGVVSSVSYSYDELGNNTLSVDGDSVTTSSGYDGDNLTLQVVTDGSGNTISWQSFTYDDVGDQTSDNDGGALTTAASYDGGQATLQTVLDSSGNTVNWQSFSYDEAGNTTLTIDGDGATTSDSYDGGNVVLEVVTDASSHTLNWQSFSYDDMGNATLASNADGVTSSGYDGNNLTLQVVMDGSTTISHESWSYDDAGRQTLTVDGDGNSTSDSYDGDNLTLEAVTNASGDPVRSTSYGYDSAGEETLTIDGDNHTRSFSYSGGLLTNETWYNADGSLADVLSFTYDADDNLLTAGNSAGTYTFTYDGGNLTSQIDPNGLTIDLSYDDAGNVTKVVDSQGGTTSLSYDAGQIATVGYQDSSLQMLLSLAYDDSGNLTSAERYADLAGTTLVGSSEYDYDAGNETSIVYKNGSDHVLTSFGYTYDEAEQLISEIDDGTTTTYGYDSSGQLTQAGSTSYGYDGNGNPIGPGVTIGPDNEVQTDGTWNYSYDGAGNLTGLTGVSNGLTWSYGYDAANELTSVTETNSSDTVLVSANYSYDAFGNRIAMTVTQDGTTTTTYSTYEAVASPQVGADLTNWRLYADIDSGHVVKTRYIGGSQPDQWFAQVVTGSGVQWDLTDHLDSVRVVVDAGGSDVLNYISYDAFGNETQTNPDAGGRLGYAGYQFDAWDDLDEAGRRFYSPMLQVWVQPDPTGLGPDANPERYVGNDPINATDPTGRLLYAENASIATEYVKWLQSPAESFTKNSVINRAGFRGLGLSNVNVVQTKSGGYMFIDPDDQEVSQAMRVAYQRGWKTDVAFLHALTSPYKDITIGWQPSEKGNYKDVGDKGRVTIAYTVTRDVAASRGRSYLLDPNLEADVARQTPALTTTVPVYGRGMRYTGERVEVPVTNPFIGSPVRMSADPFERSVYTGTTKAAAVLSNKEIMQTLRLLGGLIEVAEGVILIGNPSAPGVSQISGFVLLFHGADTMQAAMRSIMKNEEVHSFTHQGAAGLARAAGLKASADTIGMLVDFAVPISASVIGNHALKKAIERAGDVMLNGGGKTGVNLGEALGGKGRNLPVKTIKGNVAEEVLLEAQVGREMGKRATPLPLAKGTTMTTEEAEAVLMRQMQSPNAQTRSLAMEEWNQLSRAKYLSSCFAAGTPLLTPDGSKLIEEFRRGDLVLSRNENDPEGPVEAKVVEEVFVRTGRIWHLHVRGQVIRTTGEHPVFVVRLWAFAPVTEVEQGDLLLSRCGQLIRVEEVYDTGEFETVYNVRIADFHTYFVGCQEWGFSVWAHNACYVIVEGKNGILYLAKNEPGYPAVLDAANKPITGKHPQEVVAAAERLKIKNTDMEPIVLSQKMLANQVKGNSKALGNALKRAKEFPSSPADEASHLVPGSSWSSSDRSQGVKDAIRDARFILNEAGIPLDDARNGFWATSGQLGTHTDKYFLELGRVMRRARTQGGNAVETALAKLKAKVRAGKFVP